MQCNILHFARKLDTRNVSGVVEKESKETVAAAEAKPPV